LAGGAAGNILTTRSGVNCDIADASLSAPAGSIGSYASEYAAFMRASNSDAIKPSVRIARFELIIRDDDSARGLSVNTWQTI
jgi:hypothetical protein